MTSSFHFAPPGLSAMTASDATNILTILMCIAVLVQSVRMMRSLKATRESTLAEAAEALDRATAAANHVLGELKRTLKDDSRATAEALREGAALREELIVMVGIANSVAERLVDASGSVNSSAAAAVETPLSHNAMPDDPDPGQSDPPRTEQPHERAAGPAADAEARRPTRHDEHADDRTLALPSIMDVFR